MKILILSIILLITAGCSTTQKTNKAYYSEVVPVGYVFTTINYSTEEERTSLMAFVLKSADQSF